MGSYLYEQTTVARLEAELSPATFPQGPLRLDEVLVFHCKVRTIKTDIRSYGRIFGRLFGEHGSPTDDSVRLLSWLVCAKRPLKWREIQCAVSIDLEEQVVAWESRRFRVDSKELCGSIVEVHSDDRVDLVHHTAKR